MIKSYRSKLVAAFLAVITLLLMLLGGLGYSNYKKLYLESMEARLTQEAFLVAEITNFLDIGQTSRSYQQICLSAARDSDTRVTIIDSSGAVLGDSEVDPAALDNHSSRPEVYTALHGGIGVDIRYSDTLAINMLYVAVPFNNQQTSGAVRMAIQLAELQAIYKSALTAIFLAALVCGLLAILLGFSLAQRFSQPIKDMTIAVQDMAGGNLRHRISVHTGDELEELARAFNDMGGAIEQNIQEISGVRNYLQAILDNTVNGILMIGKDDRVVYANPVAVSLLSLGQGFTGSKYVEIVRTYDLLAMIDEAKSIHKPVRKSLVLHTLGAKTIEVNVVPIIGDFPDEQDILVVLNNITEIKRLEQVRKDFVANVSHELKTPVASISGFSETLLAEGGKNPDNVMEFARIIYQETQRLSYLINDLLELSKLESEEFVLKLHNVDLKLLVGEVVNRMSKSAAMQNIRIKYNDPGRPVDFNTDPVLIDLILTNLFDNAINYSMDGGQVDAGLEDLGDKVKIWVKDNGIGIPARDLTRIFERFYRVDKARSRKTGGTGLGLSIVKHAVENLDGQVTVESIEGKGSIFHVVLPKLESPDGIDRKYPG